MASNRDVNLQVSVSTVNADSISKLEQDLRDLGAQGGAAAPELERLATEVNKLGQQGDALASVGAITNKIEELTVAQRDAAAAADVLATEMIPLVERADSARDAEAQLSAALIDAKKALAEKRTELQNYKNNATDAEKASDEYKASVQAQNAQLIAGRKAVSDLSFALADAKRATAEAAAAEKEHGQAVTQAARQTDDLRKSIADENDALRTAKSALDATGLSASDLAAAQATLVSSYNATQAEIKATQAAVEAQAAAAAAAAREDERLAAIQMNTMRELQAAAKAEADGIISDYNRMVQAQKDAATQSKAAAETLSNAFGTVGVRSVQQVREEISAVRSALVTLQQSGNLTGAELKNAMQAADAQVAGLEREIRGLTGELTLADRAANLFSGSIGQFTAGNLAANAISMIVGKIQEMGSAFISTNVQLESLRRGMTAIYGDAGTAAKQIDFLRQTANTAGVSVASISDSFTRFAAATKSANIPIGTTNELFAALTQAGGALGLSSDKVSHSLDALGQMASKGQVSLEELRQQLGDSLPGAFSLMAKGLGITDAELTKLVSSGGLAARDAFPALTQALKSMGGEVDGLQPTFERFKNSLTLVAQGMGDAGTTQMLTAALKILGGVVGATALGFSVLIEAFTSVLKAGGILAGAVVTWSNPWKALNELVTDARDRLTQQAVTLNEAVLGTDKAVAATQRHVSATNQMSQATAASTPVLQMQKLATELSANQALDASAKWVKFSIAVTDAIAEQEKSVEASKKQAKGVKEQGDAMVTTIGIMGDANASQKAAAEAADNYAIALAEVSARAQQHADLLQLERDKLIESAAARGLTTDEIKVQTDAIDKKLIVARAEAEETTAHTQKAAAEAVQRRLLSETYADNSAKVGEYRKAIESAQKVLDYYKVTEEAGITTKQQTLAAVEAVSLATARYKDALEDSAKKIDLDTKAKSANLQMQLVLSNAGEQSYQILATQAKASGDLTMATYYEIEAKNKHIESMRISMQIRKLEAESEIAQLEIKKQELSINDPLYEQRVKEYDLRIKLQQIKLAEAGASQQVIDALEREKIAIETGTTTRSNSSVQTTGDTTVRLDNAAAINKQADALQRLNDLYSPPGSQQDKDKTADGFKKNADGSAKGTFTNSLPVDKAYRLLEATKSGKQIDMTQAEYDEAVKQAKDMYAYMQETLRTSPGTASTEFIQSVQALMNAANTAKVNITDKKTTTSTFGATKPASTTTSDSSSSSSSAASGSASSGSTSHTVTINIGSQSPTTINTASAADSQALIALLAQLQSAASRSA